MYAFSKYIERENAFSKYFLYISRRRACRETAVYFEVSKYISLDAHLLLPLRSRQYIYI